MCIVLILVKESKVENVHLALGAEIMCFGVLLKSCGTWFHNLDPTTKKNTDLLDSVLVPLTFAHQGIFKTCLSSVLNFVV